MEFSISEMVVWLVVGALTGPVVGMLTKRSRDGFGKWRNLGIGLVGALIGGFLLKLFNIDLDLGLDSFTISLQDLIAAFLGALLFLLIVVIIQKKG
ncbi:MAG: GlsB/YeaQ/YmgE family stress response membrane protein [Verrucomicrobia bacterium]|nr:GlsB/YeaQ/YmgE family stress response membrane protein [Verrucomicrobiota bacterium]